jgi:hypothetical protein
MWQNITAEILSATGDKKLSIAVSKLNFIFLLIKLYYKIQIKAVCESFLSSFRGEERAVENGFTDCENNPQQDINPQ